MSRKIRKRISQIVIDRKQDCGDLKRTLGDGWLHYYLYAVLFGLQPPAGIALYQWIQAICYCFAARAGLLASAVSLCVLMQWLVGVLNENRKADEPLRFPDFSLMYEAATFASWDIWGAKGDYVKSLIQKLRAVAYDCPFFRTFNGLDLDRDVISKGKSCVIEIPTVYPSWVRLFIVDLIILQILYNRIHRRAKTDDTEVIIYLDEGDQDLGDSASDATFSDNFSPQAQLFRYGREFGISCVVGLGVLGRVSEFISSSFQYTFMFNVSGGDQILRAKRALLLPPRAEEMLPGLKPGECIFRESQGAWAHPMWCKIDYVPPDRATYQIEYDSHPFIPSKSLDELPHVQEALDKLIVEHKQAKMRRGKREKADKDQLSEHAYKLIHAIPAHPWAPAQEYWKATGGIPSPNIQNSVRKELADRGLAESELIRLGSANVLLYRPTDAGWAFVKCKPPVRTGRGSIAHQHISHWCSMVGQLEDLKTTCEWLIPGTNYPGDCAWQVEEQLWDVHEVIISATNNILQHLTTLGQSSYVRNIIIVCTQKKILRQLQKHLLPEPVVKAIGDRLRWELAETFLRRLWP